MKLFYSLFFFFISLGFSVIQKKQMREGTSEKGSNQIYYNILISTNSRQEFLEVLYMDKEGAVKG
jgi:hypothetical protein